MVATVLKIGFVVVLVLVLDQGARTNSVSTQGGVEVTGSKTPLKSPSSKKGRKFFSPPCEARKGEIKRGWMAKIFHVRGCHPTPR
jgi:hypothetical protein